MSVLNLQRFHSHKTLTYVKVTRWSFQNKIRLCNFVQMLCFLSSFRTKLFNTLFYDKKLSNVYIQFKFYAPAVMGFFLYTQLLNEIKVDRESKTARFMPQIIQGSLSYLSVICYMKCLRKKQICDINVCKYFFLSFFFLYTNCFCSYHESSLFLTRWT